MREIKFRAWDNDTKEMVYQDEHTAFHIADGFIGIDCDETKGYEYREWSWKGSLNCMLMQYTGLKDMNGKEIYEGDILGIYDCDDYPLKFEVVFLKGFFGCSWINDRESLVDYLNDYCRESVIVGNIYENPEMIK